MVFFGLALLCWAQVLPLPLHWVEALAPENADAWARSLRPFGEPAPAQASLSLAPGRTLIEALKFASYGVVFVVAARWSRRDGALPPMRLIFALGVVVALVTAGHQIVGARSVYGVYQPLNSASVAPILNDNSLAGYLNLSIFCGLGLLAGPGPFSRGPLVVLGLVLMVTEVLLAQSRGAALALAVGVVVVWWLPRLLGQSRSSGAGRRTGWALAAIAAGAGGMALLGARRTGWAGLTDESLGKMDLLGWSTRLAAEQLGPGVGRGAFGSVFASHQLGGGRNASFEHAENVALQWACEWGVPATALALVALGWSLRTPLARALRRSPTRRAACVGCGVLLLQNLADLGLEIPAVAALLACALGALAGAAGRGESRPPAVPGSRLLLAGTALTAACLGVALLWGSPPLPRLRSHLHAQLAGRQGRPDPAFWRSLRLAMRQFPAEPYFPLLGASAARAAGDNPLPWISRALERAPRNAEVHVQLALILHDRGATDQALGALRHAVELDERRSHPVMMLALGWGLSPADLLRAVPDGRRGAELLRRLAQRTSVPEQRLAWLDDAVERDPGNADGHYLLAAELLADLARGERGVRCAGQLDACERGVVEHAELGRRPGHPRIDILEARLLVEQGRPTEGERHLEAACQRFPGNAHCAQALVKLLLARQSERLPGAIDLWVSAACSTTERCAGAHAELGQLLVNAGQANAALSHYQRAASESPSADAWRAVARLAERLERTTLAESAARRARVFEGGGAPGGPELPAGAREPPPPAGPPQRPLDD